MTDDLIERLRNPMWVHSGVPFYGPQLEREENLAAMEEAAAEIERLRAAQPEYLSGCQLRGPGECQKEGKCMSVACNHYNKTECRPRMTVLAQVDGILYPTTEELK